ncbi:hypothetical protein AUEXF2481DRAFT_31634 [Aureobasidium subglaciale EXF-2481]|uniref:Uncharacterized protein n=1 Tax=Aureobasidium subglaciale (strain EXF-2481) TaxID=1043005 RepID=A0A074Z2A8_AURSE|nr:uncharacterized protein AUEXF2481DRAFT_31634 [Aureobasidium subglaciale EXF-2481]KEQ93186.1 hypothetical protein AUEXF2481DRAFT_31634 [Aureobasidium subglaciale EXF-2481]
MTALSDEKLPLYSAAATSSLLPPQPTATPDDVRDFIAGLLVLTRDPPLQHARETASKWKLGTGRELNAYPPGVYADIFGSEDAWMVYRETQLFIRGREKGKNTRKDRLRKCWLSMRPLQVEDADNSDRGLSYRYCDH